MSAGSSDNQNSALGSFVEAVIAGPGERGSAYQVGLTSLTCNAIVHGCNVAIRGLKCSTTPLAASGCVWHIFLRSCLTIFSALAGCRSLLEC